MKKELFRDVALKRLSSPEQLDQRIRVTSPKSWIALFGIVLVLVVVGIWSFVGSIPTKVDGVGLLLSDGRVFTVYHNASGQVLDVRPKPDDIVHRGQVIARIDRPELVAEINHLIDTLSQMSSDEDAAVYQTTQAQIEVLRRQLIQQSQVVSPVEGRVLALDIQPGSLVNVGEPLAILGLTGDHIQLEAIIFVPVEQGGLLRVGMEAQIQPTALHREEHGFLLGRVVSVSEYPVTKESMRAILGNEALVAEFAGRGAPLMVKVDLIRDLESDSGYRWSGREGPASILHSGTAVQGSVVVKREPPISKLIPLF